MSLAADLMGLGVSPLQALKTSNAGSGPVFAGSTLAGSVSAFNTANRIGAAQYVVTVSNGVSTGGVCLPQVGSDNGCLIADDFTINNSGTTTIFLFASSGVSISVGASNTSFTQIAVHTTMSLFPLTTTQWIGVKGS